MKESSVIAHGRAQRSERLDTCPSGRTVSAPSQTANERESLSLSGGEATWMAAVRNALHQVMNRYQRQPSLWARGAVRFTDVRRTIVEGCTGDPLQSSSEHRNHQLISDLSYAPKSRKESIREDKTTLSYILVGPNLTLPTQDRNQQGNHQLVFLKQRLSLMLPSPHHFNS